ncbi:MAG: lipopolysaccharide heptosyltransferase II [Pseudolabrys sp.]|nr:lipopolysaccharide heptosyltransferase II [Pseudolabrys sp.]
MNIASRGGGDPALVVTYSWIGDFVRSHTVVKLLRAQDPDRPVDMLASSLCAPLADYMPGVRKAVVADFPHGRFSFSARRVLARRLREERYGQAIITLRTWKSALAPYLAGIPVRTGFLGELRFGLINDIRSGEESLPRMIDHMGALALPRGAPLPAHWPEPELIVPERERVAWRQREGLIERDTPVVALAPGAVGPGKAWPAAHYARLAQDLSKDGVSIWVVGGPKESAAAALIAEAGGKSVRDLTGQDLCVAIRALAEADVTVANDSGLMHVAAALGKPTVAIFGPSSVFHGAPLNPLAAVIEPPTPLDVLSRIKMEGTRAARHRNTADVPLSEVSAAVRAALAKVLANRG